MRHPDACKAVLCKLLLVSISAVALTAASFVMANPPGDEARWKDGELVAPLPADPAERAAAIAKAVEVGARKVTARGSQGRLVDVSSATVSPKRFDFRAISASPPHLGTAHTSGTFRGSGAAALDHEVSTIFGFDGIDDTGVVPPDCDIAVGQEHIFVTANSSMAIYDRCGTLLTALTYAQWLPGATGVLASGRVVYDEWDNRWVFTIIETDLQSETSKLWLFISETSDPTGNWWYYTIDVTYPVGEPPTETFADSPDLGVDPLRIVYTTNQHDFSTYVHAAGVVWIFDKPAAYANSPMAFSHTDLFNPTGGSPAYSPRCAKHRSWAGQFILINTDIFPGSVCTSHTISGSSWPPTVSSWDETWTAYTTNPPFQQPDGSYVTAGDWRIYDAVYWGGSLWAVSSQSAYVFLGVSPDFWGGSEFGNFAWWVPFGTESHCYPALDLDDDGTAFVPHVVGGPSDYLGLNNGTYSLLGVGDYDTLIAGQSNYVGMTGGTSGNPYRWGPNIGIVRDPTDERTMWVYGMYASNNPAGSWATRVTALTRYQPGILTVSGPDTTWFGGDEGEPIAGYTDYDFENTGQTTLKWKIGAQSDYWFSVIPETGILRPGQTQAVRISANANASHLQPGRHFATVDFVDCVAGSTVTRAIELVIHEKVVCLGAYVELFPNVATTITAIDGEAERGVFVSMLENFELSCVSMTMSVRPPRAVYARVYEADGTTRGALIAEGAAFMGDGAHGVWDIPVHCVLEACRDYNISIGITEGTLDWYGWDEGLVGIPFDVGGLARVLSAEADGHADTHELPPVSITGHVLDGCTGVAHLGPPAEPQPTWSPIIDYGVYVGAEQTIRLCSVGIEGIFEPESYLSAYVWEAVDTVVVSGSIVGYGSALVSSGQHTFHDIPVSGVLHAGRDYYLSVRDVLSSGVVTLFDESTITLPYSVDGIVEVVEGAFGGTASASDLPNIRITWGPFESGTPYDLSMPNGPYPPPNGSSVDYQDRGVFVTALVDMELYSIGFEADIPAGEEINVWLHGATGTTRDATIATTMTVSGGDGMRWHDIPVTARLELATDYNLSVGWDNATEWRWWDDTSGLPYDPYGVIRVRDAETGGNAAGEELIRFRIMGCTRPGASGTPTGVDPPTGVPMFVRAAPNPVSTVTHVAYGVESPGPAEITVYDVAGRRVATLLNSASVPAGNGSVDLDARGLPSGVYFLRFRSGPTTMTQKIVVTH